MLISPFTPLFFTRGRSDSLETPYRQIFAPSDVIMLQLICDPEEAPNAWITDEQTETKLTDILFDTWRHNNALSVKLARFSLPEGVYSVTVEGIGTSEVFEVTSDERELSETVLIQYAMKDNRQRMDALFDKGEGTMFFDFRVPGGFKDSGWTFAVENEQYIDEYSDTVQLYGQESTLKNFTMGDSAGIPIWFGELLNRLLVCTWVYIDGERYARSESAVPEIQQTMEGLNSFVITQTLRKAVVFGMGADDDRRVYLRRIDGKEDYRNIETGDQRVTIY